MMKHLLAAAAFAGLGILPAAAHVTLEQPEAAVGAGYKAVLRVPHGCKGSATVKLRVRVPEGVIAVKPMPKPGWTLETVKGKYAKSYPFYHGAQLSEGVKEILWSGGRLPDDFYDEFVFTGFLTTDLQPGGTLHISVVQECEQGVERWIETTGPKDEKPAPALKLIQKK